MDFLAADEELDLEPINYLAVQQEQGPCEVVVLSLVDTSETKLPAAELLLGAQAGKSATRTTRPVLLVTGRPRGSLLSR